jgi:cytochrome c biogenesis protein CcdA
MALRFQDKREELDKAVKDERRGALFAFVFSLVIMAVISGVDSWISGATLRAYEKDTAEMVAFYVVLWIGYCAHSEFRIRMNATFGAVFELQSALSAIQSRLESIDKDLLPVKAEPRTSRQPIRLPLPD